MKLNGDIAKNMTKQSPEVVSVFWSTLSTDLNALGPPAKSVSEWKKVYIKCAYVKFNLFYMDFLNLRYGQILSLQFKKKMSHNRSQMQATGGGPNAEIPLTALEEEVAQLICIQDTITGVSGRNNYGVPQEPRVGQIESTNSVPTSGVTSDESIPEAISATSTRPQSRVQKKSQLKMLKTQIDLQKKISSESFVQFG
ncbi:PREDICTED: uncharacterized protein LOC108361484 [Rhagoletis zephyria]|uniref:uncharacterized protein LOC108361484 n=1 Tax=Rhagoletis zephyria TaxID=28612 RepID=UPI0008117D67|nr:PREDICTED: uncharacterized protein LOC108361484 [Rhagoletis zephyria]